VPRLTALPAPCGIAGTETAQRFLVSAHESVESVLDSIDIRRAARGAGRGRLTSPEEDLLRAAIVFTGAGLDATLKRLIRDTLPAALDKSDQAHKMFEGFSERQLGTGEWADKKKVARYLLASSARAELIEEYVYDLTGSSLQSAEEVDKTARALGVTDRALLDRIGHLKPLFVARNEVSHELDLQELERPGDRTRRGRGMTHTAEMCSDTLEVAQLIVNAVGEVIASSDG
jgi:hypothetical protein